MSEPIPESDQLVDVQGLCLKLVESVLDMTVQLKSITFDITQIKLRLNDIERQLDPMRRHHE